MGHSMEVHRRSYRTHEAKTVRKAYERASSNHQAARSKHQQQIPGGRPSAGVGEPPQAPLSGVGRGGGDQLITPALQGVERSRRTADAEGMPGGDEGQQRRSVAPRGGDLSRHCRGHKKSKIQFGK